ncbi:MAG: S1C family serine protease [Acidimicrobiales bacterium]
MAGEGAEDEEGAPEEPLRPPPDPDDRLWRHPSEVAGGLSASGSGAPGAPGPGATQVRRWPRRGRLAGVVLAAGAAGALLSTGLLMASGQPDLHIASVGSGASRARTSTPTTASAGAPAIPGATTIQVSPDLREMIQHLLPGVVAIDASGPTGHRRGTGLVYRSNGMIVTTTLLVDGANTLTVTSSDGRQWSANVLGTDPGTGIAVISVPATGLTALPLGSSDGLQVGQMAVAVTAGTQGGTPFHVAFGLIDAVHQQVSMKGGRALLNAVETAAPPANPVGGVVLDDHGRVIGLLQSVLAQGGSTLGVATPVSTVEEAASQLAAGESVVHAWLGVVGSDLSAARARPFGLAGGATVDQVEPASPAAIAGVEPGDVITAVNGTPVTSMTALQEDLASLTPGSPIFLGLLRHGVPVMLSVTLDGRPGS